MKLAYSVQTSSQENFGNLNNKIYKLGLQTSEIFYCWKSYLAFFLRTYSNTDLFEVWGFSFKNNMR